MTHFRGTISFKNLSTWYHLISLCICSRLHIHEFCSATGIKAKLVVDVIHAGDLFHSSFPGTERAPAQELLPLQGCGRMPQTQNPHTSETHIFKDKNLPQKHLALYLHTCLQPLLPRGLFSSPWGQQTVFQSTLMGNESYCNDVPENDQQMFQPSISDPCKMLRMRNYFLWKLVGKNQQTSAKNLVGQFQSAWNMPTEPHWCKHQQIQIKKQLVWVH